MRVCIFTQNRASLSPELMSLVRFQLLSPDVLVTKVHPEVLMTSGMGCLNQLYHAMW